MNHAKPEVQEGEVVQSTLIRGATVDKRIKLKILAGEYIKLSSLVRKVME